MLLRGILNQKCEINVTTWYFESEVWNSCNNMVFWIRSVKSM